jgi:hypothetical protein
MRFRTAPRRISRRRNSVVHAIVHRMANIAARRHRDERKPTRQEADHDLAQRVRESGEW